MLRLTVLEKSANFVGEFEFGWYSSLELLEEWGK